MEEIKKFFSNINPHVDKKQPLQKINKKPSIPINQNNKKESTQVKSTKLLTENVKLMVIEHNKKPEEINIESIKETIVEKVGVKETDLNISKKKSKKFTEKVNVDKFNNTSDKTEKNNFPEVKSKVKAYLEEKSKVDIPTRSKKKKVEKTKSEIIRAKKSKYNQNFIAIDLKKNWQEKKLVKVPNMRKFKLKKEKYFNKLRKNIMNMKDEKYLGRGKAGLDEIDHNKEPEEILIDHGGNNFKDDQQIKIPFFSEGYYKNELKDLESMLNNEKVNNEKVNNEMINNHIHPMPENQKKDEGNTNDQSKLNLSLTPDKKDLTKRLSTIIKSSQIRPCVLDTELRKLSKEFRNLLSGKKIENEDVIQKKLSFNNIIEENNESMEESINQEDIEALESEILKKVLKENFGYDEFRNGQLETIKNILNGKNTLLILPPATGKSLCYQVPAFVLDGLTIVISPMISLITDQLSQLPSCLAGASLSGNTSHRQRNEIFQAINQKKIKILFITPERMCIENFQEIKDVSLVCFDEANCSCPLSQSFRSAYVTVNHIIENMKPGVLLFLANNSTSITEVYLTKKHKLELIKEKISFSTNLRITINKDDNKIVSLVKLLSSKPYKNIGSVIIFCNLKKNVDKVASYLNSKGISSVKYHSGLPFIDRQIIQTNFMNGNSKIIVATMGFIMGISKSDIRMIIIYDIPPSIEHFIQQIGRGGRDLKECFVHVFLNDEDYFAQRNMNLMESIDKTQVLKFIEGCFNSNGNPKSNKRTFNEAFEENNETKDFKQTNLPKTIAINFNYLNTLTGIKRQNQISILMNLIESNIEGLKLKCIGICPIVINLRFFKTAAEELIKTEPTLYIILNGCTPYQGIYRVNVLEVCEKLNFTNFDLLNYLYILQCKGELGYDIKDEGMFLVIEELPNSFGEMINYAIEKSQYLIKLNIKKLNSSYVILRKFSIVSIDPILKHDKNSSVKCLTHYSSFSEYEKDLKDNIEKFFSLKDCKLCFKKDDADVELAGDQEELQKMLPIIILDTQKEKNSISKDIEDILKKEYENNQNLTSVDIINITFGIHINETKNFYHSNPLWNRYYQYEYDVIKEIVDSAFMNVKSEQISKQSLKKKKTI